MLRSDDPLPQNVIRFPEAFEQFYRTIEPKWQELEAARNDAFSAYEKHDFRQKQQDEWHATMDALDSARISAWRQWRSKLESGQFVACIRDPEKGVILELDKKGWAGPQGLGPRCSLDDFICPNDPIQPGPLAAIGGKLRPVFFMKRAFASALMAMGRSVASGGRRGRKPSYDRAFIRKLVFELMDHHGEFQVSDPEWRTRADLERAVMAELEKQGDRPAESTVRTLITAPLEEWYESRPRR